MTEEVTQGVTAEVSNTETAPTAETVEAVEAQGTNDSPESAEQSPADVAAEPELTIEEKLAKSEAAKDEAEKKIKRQKAALRRANEDAQKLREYEARIAEIEKANKVNDEPNPDDYENMEDYYREQGKWQAKQELQEQEKKRLEAEKSVAEQKRMAEKLSRVQSQESEFRAEVPDYDDAVEEMNEFIVAQNVQKDSIAFQAFTESVFSSEVAPAIMYELGKNAELRDELMGLEPIAVVRKIIEIENTVKGRKSPSIKPDLKPAPPKPVGAKGKAAKSLAKSSGKDVLAWVNS